MVICGKLSWHACKGSLQDLPFGLPAPGSLNVCHLDVNDYSALHQQHYVVIKQSKEQETLSLHCHGNSYVYLLYTWQSMYLCLEIKS